MRNKKGPGPFFSLKINIEQGNMVEVQNGNLGLAYDNHMQA